MRAEVRAAYRTLIHLGRALACDEMPNPARSVREAFRKNAGETDSVKIDALVARAAFVAREAEALIQLKKYRRLKRSYYEDF